MLGLHSKLDGGFGGGATRRAHVKNKVAEECVFFLEFFFLPGPFFFLYLVRKRKEMLPH